MDKKSFLEMNRGAILERVDYELGRVFDNIMDINTPAAKARKLTITIDFKPNDDRTQVNHSAIVKSTVQPTSPITGALAVVGDKNGVVQMVEMVPQIPGQQDLYGNEQIEPNVIEFQKRA
ncbi:MAG: hypothetical protein RSE54_04055 [Ruthenibacterium sp.]